MASLHLELDPRHPRAAVPLPPEAPGHAGPEQVLPSSQGDSSPGAVQTLETLPCHARPSACSPGLAPTSLTTFLLVRGGHPQVRPAPWCLAPLWPLQATLVFAIRLWEPLPPTPQEKSLMHALEETPKVGGSCDPSTGKCLINRD